MSDEVSPQVTSMVKGTHVDEFEQMEVVSLVEPAATEEIAEETNVRAASALQSLATAMIRIYVRRRRQLYKTRD
jgi:hypothetical protein